VHGQERVSLVFVLASWQVDGLRVRFDDVAVGERVVVSIVIITKGMRRTLINLFMICGEYWNGKDIKY
jgi:hypothetical protein